MISEFENYSAVSVLEPQLAVAFFICACVPYKRSQQEWKVADYFQQNSSLFSSGIPPFAMLFRRYFWSSETD